MDPTLLGILITAVLGIPGGAGLWQYLSNRRDRPLRAKEVENATQEVETTTATAVQAIYSGVLGDLRTELDRLSTEVASQGNQIKELRTALRAQETVNSILRTVIQTASAWIDDLHHRWDYHRAQPSAPPKPHLNYDYE